MGPRTSPLTIFQILEGYAPLSAGLETLIDRNAFAKVECQYPHNGGGEVSYEAADVDIDQALGSYNLDPPQVVLVFSKRF